MTPNKEDKKAHLSVEVKYTYISKKRKRICKFALCLEGASVYI